MGVGAGALENLEMKFDWRGRRVLVTGHTGFKGAWAARWLGLRGAEVIGLSLPPAPAPNLSTMLGERHLAGSVHIDLRDIEGVRTVVDRANPEIVLHFAAQPLVRASYEDPVGTFATNVMGTVHLLEAMRASKALRVALTVTSDKVYENDGTGRPYAENDRLGGSDPYSASKTAVEAVVACFARSFFDSQGVRLVTVRGGNVIGGGDFAADRLVPDIVRAAMAGQALQLRHPEATRPWQHVLDCLSGYFTYVEALLTDRELPQSLNFGPPADAPVMSVGEVAARVQTAMGLASTWRRSEQSGPAEKPKLSLDPNSAMKLLNWRPRLDAETAIGWTAEWYSAFLNGADMADLTQAHIARYEEMAA
jgi:CDP-glucose 4,6-dehydratase